MKGDHDLPIHFNNSTFVVNSKIHKFRTQLFEEHFGMSYQEVLFPNSNVFWSKAWNVAHANMQIYEKIFNCYPSNTFTTWESLVNTEKKKFDREAYDELSRYISGHAVSYPYKFLSEESLIKVKEKGILYFLPFKALF